MASSVRVWPQSWRMALGLVADVAGQRGQIGRQIVSAALLKLLQEIAGPVRAVDFQAVAEDGIRRILAHRLQHRFADEFQMVIDGRAVVVIEHKALGADGRAFHRLARAARDEEQHHAPLARLGRHAHGAVVDLREAANALGGKLPAVSARQKRGDELLSLRNRRQRHRRGIRRHGHVVHPQPPGRQGDGRVRAAEWPAASQRQVEAQPQLVRLLRGEAQVVEKLIGQIRKIAETALRIVERQRISRLHLESADAAFFHGAQLALQFRLGHRGTEPPPAHHHAGIVGRLLEGAPQIRHGRRRDRAPAASRHTAAKRPRTPHLYTLRRIPIMLSEWRAATDSGPLLESTKRHVI